MSQDRNAPKFKTINLSYDSNNHRFHITADIVDDITGVERGYIYLWNPSKSKQVATILELNTSTGSYEGYIQLNDYAEAGTWTIDYVRTWDKADNSEINSQTQVRDAKHCKNIANLHK